MRSRTLKIVGIIFAALGVLALVGFVVLTVLVASKGDPPPEPGFRIVNRTDTELRIFAVPFYFPSNTPTPAGSGRALIAEIQPHSEGEGLGPCARSNQYVARAPDGSVIDRHGPFRSCNPAPWVIEEATDEDL